MSATFACPHCGATYPRKPVLVGRAVRCTTCKNAFCLREDGIADPVGAPTPAAEPQPSAPPQVEIEVEDPPAAAAPAPAPTRPNKQPMSTGWDMELELKTPLGNEIIPDQPTSLHSGSDDSSRFSGRKTGRMTRQQLESRRAMAATLSDSMTAALQSEAVKREEQANLQKAKKAEGQVGKIGPAVLTGQGVEEAKEIRYWWLGVIAFFIFCYSAWWLLFTETPQEAAISKFTGEVEAKLIRSGKRISTIQERAWLTGLPPAMVGVPPVIDMRDARIGREHTIKLNGTAEIFASVAGLVPVEPGPIWVPPERVSAVNDYRRENQTEKEFIALALKREKKAVSHPDLLNKLKEQTGMTDEDVKLIDLLMRGQTATDGSNDIFARWLKGDIPQAVEVANFWGSNGLMLLSRGQSFKTNSVSYKGNLVRFVGEGWPQEWKILTLSTALKPQF